MVLLDTFGFSRFGQKTTCACADAGACACACACARRGRCGIILTLSCSVRVKICAEFTLDILLLCMFVRLALFQKVDVIRQDYLEISRFESIGE